MFPSWFDVVRFEEVVVFTCGLMDDASPLVNYVYQIFCVSLISRFRTNEDYNKSKGHLKRLGKELLNTNLFHLLYSESVVPIVGSPLQNRHINWLDHSDDEQKEMPRNVHFPSKHFEFHYLRRKLCDFKHPANRHVEKPECTMFIIKPASEVTKDILSMCCEISQDQEITDLWMEDINYHHNTDDMKLRLRSHTMSLTVKSCKLPQNLTSQLLEQLAICKRINEIFVENFIFGDLAHFIPKAISSWESPSLEALTLGNCSIPEESCCEILKSLASCQHIIHLDLSGSHVGSSGKYLAEAIKNWGYAPSLQRLGLTNCSIPGESCAEIFKSFTICQHITYLDLAGNHVGASGKYLAEAIKNWGDAPSLQLLYLENCSIPEESCTEILRNLNNCQNLKYLNLSGNHVGASAKYLEEAIRKWGNAPSLVELQLENCSIPEESCYELLKSLTTCQHVTHLNLSGNYIGTSGKYFAEAINNWGDVQSLEYLNLENCSIPKAEWCEILQSLINLIEHQRLPKLRQLVLSENQLHVIEDEVGKLLNTCLTKHQAELILFLDNNGFSTQFVDHWKEICAGSRLKPVFEYDPR